MTEEEILHFCIGETGNLASFTDAMYLDFDLLAAHGILSRTHNLSLGSEDRRQLKVASLEHIAGAKDDVFSLKQDLPLIQQISPQTASGIKEHIDTIEEYLDLIPVESDRETAQRLAGLTDLSYSLMKEVRDSTIGFIAKCYVEHLT